MSCTVKGCCNSASIDSLCLAHYAEIKDVTLTEAILEHNRRAKDRFEAELKLQMGIQNIRMGDESRAVAADLETYRRRFEEESAKCKQRIARIQAAAKPKEERQYALMAQQANSCRVNCKEEGCGMDGFGHYGGLCRDHYYERKHDKPDWFIVIPDALVFVVGTMLSLMGLAGILEERIDLVLLACSIYAVGVRFLWSELGLSRDWKWKRADKPRIPTKGAAKTKPFELPSVEQP